MQSLCVDVVGWFVCPSHDFLDVDCSGYHGQNNTHVCDELARSPSLLGCDISGAVPRGSRHLTTLRRQGSVCFHVHNPPRRRLASRASQLGELKWAHATDRSLPITFPLVLTLSSTLYLVSSYTRPNRISNDRAPPLAQCRQVEL